MFGAKQSEIHLEKYIHSLSMFVREQQLQKMPSVLHTCCIAAPNPAHSKREAFDFSFSVLCSRLEQGVSGLKCAG